MSFKTDVLFSVVLVCWSMVGLGCAHEDDPLPPAELRGDFESVLRGSYNGELAIIDVDYEAEDLVPLPTGWSAEEFEWSASNSVQRLTSGLLLVAASGSNGIEARLLGARRMLDINIGGAIAEVHAVGEHLAVEREDGSIAILSESGDVLADHTFAQLHVDLIGPQGHWLVLRSPTTSPDDALSRSDYYLASPPGASLKKILTDSATSPLAGFSSCTTAGHRLS